MAHMATFCTDILRQKCAGMAAGLGNEQADHMVEGVSGSAPIYDKHYA